MHISVYGSGGHGRQQDSDIYTLLLIYKLISVGGLRKFGIMNINHIPIMGILPCIIYGKTHQDVQVARFESDGDQICGPLPYQ